MEAEKVAETVAQGLTWWQSSLMSLGVMFILDKLVDVIFILRRLRRKNQ